MVRTPVPASTSPGFGAPTRFSLQRPERRTSAGFRSRRDHLAPAAKLYVGPYPRARRAAAERLTGNLGFLLILSYMHGFVPLASVLEPYDVPLGRPGSISANELRQQARMLGSEQADVTVLSGRAYVEACRAM